MNYILSILLSSHITDTPIRFLYVVKCPVANSVNILFELYISMWKSNKWQLINMLNSLILVHLPVDDLYYQLTSTVVLFKHILSVCIEQNVSDLAHLLLYCHFCGMCSVELHSLLPFALTFSTETRHSTFIRINYTYSLVLVRSKFHSERFFPRTAPLCVV